MVLRIQPLALVSVSIPHTLKLCKKLTSLFSNHYTRRIVEDGKVVKEGKLFQVHYITFFFVVSVMY